MRKEVLFGIAVVLTLSLFLAYHEPILNLTALSIMETTQGNANLTINNFGSSDTITKVELTLSGVSATALANYNDWQENYTAGQITWSNGTIATNVLLSLFQFGIEAPKVTQNTTGIISIYTLDRAGYARIQNFSVNIINDDTAPNVSNVAPQDGNFLKTGAIINASISAVDLETGVERVEFNHMLCSGNTSITTVLSGSGTYSAVADLSSYLNADSVCFIFTATNRGGSNATSSGTLIIDGIPPTVQLDAPGSGATVNAAQDFIFTATDNLAADLTCTVVIDGTDALNISATSGVQTHIASQNLSEGSHSWQVRCQDRAGWENISSTASYTLDRTPPTMTATPVNGSIVASSQTLFFTMVDNYGLGITTFDYLNLSQSTTDGNFSILALTFPDGPTPITVTLRDTVGNQKTEEYVVIVDRTAPEFNAIGPIASDVHVNFTINVTDTWDASLSCSLFITNISNITTTTLFNATKDESTIVSALLPVGDYNYYVTCADDALNTQTSSGFNLTVTDTTGPDITFNHGNVAYRGTTFTLNTTLFDISGIDHYDATWDEPTNNTIILGLLRDGNDYYLPLNISSNVTLGNYTFEIFAVDDYGNSNFKSSDILITYGSSVSLALSSSSITTGAAITASGSAQYDNGTLFDSGSVDIITPDQNYTVALVNGAYSQSFTPSTSGDVVVRFTAPNGLVVSSTAAFTVSAPSSSSGSSGGGHGGSSQRSSSSSTSSSTTADTCNTEWTCDSWSACSNGEQTRLCSDSCTDARRKEVRGCEEQQVQITADTTLSASKEMIIICLNAGTQNQKEMQIPAEKWSGYEGTAKKGSCPALASDASINNGNALGAATGFLSIVGFNGLTFAILIALVLGIAGSLYFFGSGQDDWNDYMRRRRNV